MTCGVKLEAYMTAAQLAALTLVGDVSSFSVQGNRFPAVFSYTADATYTVDANKATVGLDYAVMCEGACTLTLPSGTAHAGRTLLVCVRTAALVVSATANVTTLTGAATTSILPATAGAWALLQYDTVIGWSVLANNALFGSQTMSAGANDSGGTGYRVLVVPNA